MSTKRPGGLVHKGAKPISEFTPGPWNIGRNMHPSSENFNHPAIGAEGRELAIAIIPVIDDVADANAQLIAAAPDLLEALQGLLAFCGGPCTYDEPKRAHLEDTCSQCKAQTAITKATGAPKP